MLISFFTLILAFCVGILSGLYFRKRVSGFIGIVLSWVIGAFAAVLLTYGCLKVLLWMDVITSVNTAWFIRQCVWLSVLALIGVFLSGKALNKSE